MVSQPQTRQPDETICFSCGTTVKRDFDNCPNCGSKIARGPEQATPPNFMTPGREGWNPAPEPWENVPHATNSKIDEVGAGRYIINFILAGLIGLGITYFFRREGWLATYICIPIFILVVIVVASR